jgi:hypothetical protein
MTLNAESMIVRPQLLHGFGLWCKAITNIMLFPATHLSCASFNDVLTGCGGVLSLSHSTIA